MGGIFARRRQSFVHQWMMRRRWHTGSAARASPVRRRELGSGIRQNPGHAVRDLQGSCIQSVPRKPESRGAAPDVSERMLTRIPELKTRDDFGGVAGEGPGPRA